MKKQIMGLLLLLMLVSTITAVTNITHNINMYRDSNGNWNGRIYEAEVTDNNQLYLWLLGKNLNRNECLSRWDLVLYEDTTEIYRAVKRLRPNRRGTFQAKLNINLDAGTYDDVLVKYECPSNSDWDISAEQTMSFTIEEEQATPPPYCSFWMSWFGYC